MANIFATDVDGVLLRTYQPGIDYINEKTGLRFTEKHLTCYNWFEDVFGLTKKEQEEAWHKTWDTPASLYKGASKFVKSLKTMGFFVLGISHRPKGWINGKARTAADRDFEKLGLDDYVLTHNEPKSEVINRYKGIKFFIDDKPSNVIDVAMKTKAVSMLLDRPWNKSFINPLARGGRVNSYKAALWYMGQLDDF